MGVGRQSRRVCFGAKPDKGFLDMKISPYPEVVRGGEWELTTRPRERQLVVGGRWAEWSWWLEPRRERVGGWTGERRVGGRRPREVVGGWRAERRQLRLDRREANSRSWRGRTARGSQHQTPDSRKARQHGIGSSDSESRWVWFQ